VTVSPRKDLGQHFLVDENILRVIERLAELEPADVEAMLAGWDRSLSPKTARNAFVVLRRALGQAARLRLIAYNPAAREYIDAPKADTKEPDAFTDEEITRLLAASKGHRIEPLIALAVETGLRQGELLGLAWEDISADAVTVRKELVWMPGDRPRHGRYTRGEPKTPRSRRTVPLTPAAKAAIERQRERLIADGFVPIATGPVFTNHRGRALSGSWVTHELYDLEKKAGIRRLPFKNLRTSFSTRLHAAGVPDVTIAALMGHTRTATTKRHYIAVGASDLRGAIEKLGAA